MVNEGDKVPKFSVKDTEGDKVSNEDIDKAVIYFYPKDDTPGCTKEACGFRDNIKKITKFGFEVYGVNNDDKESHEKFSSKYELNFPLLCDTDAEMSKAFDVYGEKNIFGNKVMGIYRSTFIIDDGKIMKAWEKVKPEGHAEEVIEFLEEYNG